MKTAVEVPDLEPLEGDPHHASELTQLLRRYVEGEDPSRPSERSLRELVEAAVARLGYAFPSSCRREREDRVDRSQERLLIALGEAIDRSIS